VTDGTVHDWSVENAAPGVHARVAGIIGELFPEPRGLKALDLPCGRGNLTRALEERGFEAWGMDIQPQPAFLAAPGRLVVGDANLPLPFEAGSFDLAVSVEGIEHLENPSFFLRELDRVVRPGGKVVLTTPNVNGFRARLKVFLDGFPPFFNPVSDREKASGHLLPVDLVFLNGALAKTGLTLARLSANRVREGALARGLIRRLRPLLTRRLPPVLAGETVFFGEVLVLVLEKRGR